MPSEQSQTLSQIDNYLEKSYKYGGNYGEPNFINYLITINNANMWEDSTVGTSEGNIINSEIRSSKKLAKDLGFFEKRTVAEAKDIINQYSGGKHFLKNKRDNLREELKLETTNNINEIMKNK